MAGTMRSVLRWGIFAVVGAAGCSAGGSDASGGTAEGSHLVTQGGAQDIARFRSIVARGAVPALDTLDPIGFFAEHAVDLPPADCGRELCLHPLLAVAPRFDGSNWTMAFVAMNSPLDPETLERPPLHLVVAAEHGAETANAWSGVEIGLRQLGARLRPDDRLSVLAYGDGSQPLLVGADPSTEDFDTTLGAAIASVSDPMAEGVALYEGLADAARLARGSLEGFEGRSRILLLTTGRADAGITDPERILDLAGGLARDGVAVNVVGLGDRYEPRISRAIAEAGGSTHAYAEDDADLEQILAHEGDTHLFPLARDLEVRVAAATGYRVGRIYGMRNARATPSDATLTANALYLGHRTGSHDVEGGRRGGGGGLFVELLAEPDAAAMGPEQPAFTIDAEWQSPDGEARSVHKTTVNGLAPGENPDGMWPEISDPERGKPFMMLNMYLTLRSALEFYEAGDCARAKGVIDMVVPTVVTWQQQEHDPDIWDDLDLVVELRENLDTHCVARPVEPQLFRGSCFAS